VRIALSVWLTPWFARWTILPFLGLFKRKKKVPVVENTVAKVDVQDTKPKN